MKKLLCVLLSIIVMMSCMLTVSASETVATDGVLDFQYASDGETYTVSECEPVVMDVVVIPEEVDGIPVTEISAYAFSGNDRITEVIIPDSVTTIGESAFEDCVSLEKITISDGVTWILNNTFKGCTSLEEVRFSNNLKVIDESAFLYCPCISKVICTDNAIDFSELKVYKGNDDLFLNNWICRDEVSVVITAICGAVLLGALVLLVVLFLKKKNKIYIIIAVAVLLVAVVGVVFASINHKRTNDAFINYSSIYFNGEFIYDGYLEYFLEPLEATKAENCTLLRHKGEEILWGYDFEAPKGSVGECNFKTYVWADRLVACFYDTVTMFNLDTGEVLSEFSGYSDVVKIESDGGTTSILYIIYNGGRDFAIVTTTGNVLDNINAKDNLFVDLYEEFEMGIIVERENGDSDLFEPEIYWNKCILSVEASSTLAPQGNKKYDAENLFDGDFSTVWSEGVDGSGIGEKIKVTIDPCLSDKVFNVTCDSFDIEFYSKNNAVKTIKVTDSMGGSKVVDLSYQYDEWFAITEGSEWFEIEIVDIEKGTTYDDTCISEISISDCSLVDYDKIS